MSRQLVVEIVGDSTKFTSATKGAITEATNLSGKLRGVGKGMVLGAGIGAFGLLTGAIGGAVGKLDEAAEAFREDQASQSLLSNAIKNAVPGWDGNTAAIEANLSAWQRKGVSDSAQREGLTALVNKTGDLSSAMALNGAAIELAAATGKTYDEAVAEIVSGLNGKGAALAKDGIAMTKNMTATDLATTITDKYKGSQDALAETSDGKLAVSQEKVGEAMEKVGGAVDTVSQAVAPLVADVLTGLVDIFGDVWTATRPIREALAPIIKGVFGAIGTAVGIIVDDVFPALGRGIGAVQDAFKAMGTFVGKIWDGITTAIKTAINGIIGLINGVIGAVNAFQIHIDVPNPFGGSIARVDWEGLNLGKIAYLHAGGVVPGAPGSDVLTVLQAGELVTPAGRAGGPTVVNINIASMSGVNDPRAFLQELKREVDRQGLSLVAS